MDAITYFGGKKYLHSDYNTPAKQKNLPESVIKAIQGNVETAPVEPTQVEPTIQVEETTAELTPVEQTQEPVEKATTEYTTTVEPTATEEQ
jgi:hypothetical protein